MTQLQRQAEPWPAISWMLAGAICLALAPPLLAQRGYSMTDADGDVACTDTPPLSGDSTIEEHSVHALNAAKPTQTTPATSALADAEEPTHYDTRILNPADNAAIPMGPGDFALKAAWNPRLASGETLQLLLDGEPVGAPQQTASWQLSNVYRGERRQQVVRLDENGAQLDASAASTVYVLRPSVNS